MSPKDASRIPVRLLLDTGSNNSFVVNKQSFCRYMKLLGEENVVLQSFGQRSDSKIRNIFQACLASSPCVSTGEKFHYVQLISVEKITNSLYGERLTKYQSDFIKHHGIILADHEAVEGKLLSIDILIGQDFYHDLVKSHKLHLSDGLVLISTIAGYTLGGKVDDDNVDSNISISTINYISSFQIITREEELMNIKQFSCLESLGIGPLEEEISPVLDRFNVNTKHNGERYTVILPKRHNKLKDLPSNCPLSFSRLISTYKKLTKSKKDQDLIEYSNVIKEQLESGVLEMVGCLGTTDEVSLALNKDPKAFDNAFLQESGNPVHYLPHFSVRKRSTGKIRLVYDGAAKATSKSFSLNDCLETGPDLINSLLCILIRFRIHKFAMKSDIRKAFLQIEIGTYDRNLLRSLWIEDGNVMVYRFARLPFGLTCSPFILAATLRKHLNESDLSLETQEKILQAFYVDDNVTGADTSEELIENKSLLESTFKEAGMEITQFNSNDPRLRNLLRKSDPDLPEQETVLGVGWNLIEDNLSINSDYDIDLLGPSNGRSRKPRKNSKRDVYSKLGKTFDPCGFISPFTFLGKIILRDICENVKKWDSKLPIKYLEIWETWTSQLPHLSSFKLPRYVSISGDSNITIVGFCDASKLGFAANIYYVAEDSSGNVKSNLLLSKTRLAPKKITSIPRLELCGALLLVNLMSHVKKALPELNSTQFYYFTDSLDVLFWLRSDSFDWPVFISNRLQQCWNGADVNSWRHVRSPNNPADIPSRGCDLSTLFNDRKKRTLFYEGPDFLKGDIASYQSEVDMKVMPQGCSQELGRVSLTIKTSKPISNISNVINLTEFSTYTHLITVSAFVLRGVDKLIHKFLHLKTPVKSIKTSLPNVFSHWRMAEILWIRAVQHQHYEDYFILSKGSFSVRGQGSFSNIPADSKNNFLRMNIFLDDDLQILRCKTRFCDSSMDYATMNPILLPPESHFTLLLIRQTHQRILHAGKAQTVAAVRSEFYVPRLTKLTTKILRGCTVCNRAYGATYNLPPPPPLPDFRIKKDRAFANIGLDYAGPFYTRERFTDKTFIDYKSYILVFTCAVTRAVHFEATNTLNVYDFKLALQRFISSRGAPDLIISDNALTFYSAKAKLQAIYKNKDIQTLLCNERIQWQFYTDKAPWKGGFIETIVSSFKRISNKVIGNHHLSFEEFRTVVKAAESIVNSRPLTGMYEGLEEGVPLTPSMLIHGFTLTDLPSHGIPNEEKAKINEKDKAGTLKLEHRYHLIENVKDHFWKRFLKQYTTELHERHIRQSKHLGHLRVPKVGDLCLLKLEVTPRRRWPLAVIERVDISPRDNKVRTVGIRIYNKDKGTVSHLDRSPSLLVPLEEDVES